MAILDRAPQAAIQSLRSTLAPVRGSDSDEVISPPFELLRGTQHRNVNRATLHTVAGSISALLLFALGIIPFQSGIRHDLTPIAKPLAAPTYEFRQFSEGIAVSHYATTGARSTGHRKVQGAPSVVIIGDSHVQAAQVADSFTMGARVEEQSKSAGTLVNVIQLGWSGAGLPTYEAVGPQLDAAWKPEHLVVTLNEGDWTTRSDDISWTREISGVHRSKIHRLIKSLLFSLPILAASFERWEKLHKASTQADEQPVELQKTSLSADKRNDEVLARDLVESALLKLQSIYGSRLVLTYLASVGLTGGYTPTENERQLLDFCQAHHLTCASTRTAMVADRDKNHRVSRGFMTGSPGVGHLNEIGHSITGGVIWSEIAPPARLARSRP